nr:vesicle-associated protein 2-2-like [Ipomoea batatas]
MTGRQLVVIQPPELKFTFEVMKQSSCVVHLTNITDQYVAFKVKTTSPKKYCVRPNIGIIKPKATVEFRVTMQAQSAAPFDMQCKDKFLIQSTVVPFGKMEEVMPEMFTKDEGKYIQENKIRVFLISPPQSPVLQPVNGVLKEESPDNTSTLKEKFPIGVENLPPPHTLIDNSEDTKNAAGKEDPRLGNVLDVADLAHPKSDISSDELAESRSLEDVATMKVTFSKDFEEMKAKLGVEQRSVEDVETTNVVFSKDFEEVKAKLDVEQRSVKDVETTKVTFSKDFEELKAKLGVEPRSVEEVETIKVTSSKDFKELKPKLGVEPRSLNGVESIKVAFSKDTEELKPKLQAELISSEDVETKKVTFSKDIEDLKAKLGALNSKLIEAEHTISKLNQEKENIAQEKENLKQELVLFRKKTGVTVRKVQVGFPPLFLCMTALVGLAVGFLLRA